MQENKFWDRPPPDFSKDPGWQFEKIHSIFYNFETEELDEASAQSNDAQLPNWIGYRLIYFLKKDEVILAKGSEIIFFGKSTALKFWRLNSDKVYACFSVIFGPRWQTFLNRDFRHGISVYYRKGDQDKKLAGVFLRVYNRIAPEPIIDLNIQR